MDCRPGRVVLFGSGETSPSAQRIYRALFEVLERPVRIAILETPAGFELNSDWVAGRVADYLEHHLQNFSPQISIVPARRRGTPFSPDDPDIVTPLLRSNAIYMGAGSPTYAVRQLRDSLTWQVTRARHSLGAGLLFASASVLAVGAYTIPVYEIYKVGEDLHWTSGLDVLGPYGLDIAFVPHWNNNDGGENLDTSHCFMGEPRFLQLRAMLPEEVTIVGIDESTGLAMDLLEGTCEVMGLGGVTLIRGSHEQRFEPGQPLDLGQMGPHFAPTVLCDIPDEVQQMVLSAAENDSEVKRSMGPELPQDVLDLVNRRENARACRDWAASDQLRDEIKARGWSVRDTPEGPEVVRVTE